MAEIIDVIIINNKKIQCYGFISLEHNHDYEKLINSKNRLSFKIKHNINASIRG